MIFILVEYFPLILEKVSVRIVAEGLCICHQGVQFAGLRLGGDTLGEGDIVLAHRAHGKSGGGVNQTTVSIGVDTGISGKVGLEAFLGIMGIRVQDNSGKGVIFVGNNIFYKYGYNYYCEY